MSFQGGRAAPLVDEYRFGAADASGGTGAGDDSLIAATLPTIRRHEIRANNAVPG